MLVPEIDISDFNSAELSKAEVRLSGGDSGDTLFMLDNSSSAAISTALSSTTDAEGKLEIVLTLTGIASIDNYRRSLRSIAFTSTASYPSVVSAVRESEQWDTGHVYEFEFAGVRAFAI